MVHAWPLRKQACISATLLAKLKGLLSEHNDMLSKLKGLLSKHNDMFSKLRRGLLDEFLI